MGNGQMGGKGSEVAVSGKTGVVRKGVDGWERSSSIGANMMKVVKGRGCEDTNVGGRAAVRK